MSEVSQDLLWKEVISEFFQEFLEFFFPEIYGEIEFSAGFKALNPELRGEKVVDSLKVADLLFEVKLKNGEEKIIIVHVEVQGYPQKEFAKRMFTYYYRVLDRYEKDVVSLAVLTDRNPRFRPDRYEFKLDGFRVLMEFPVVKLLDYEGSEKDLEGSENPFALITLAWLRSRLEVGRRLEEKERLFRELARIWLRKGWEKERLRKLVIFIDSVLRLPKDLEERLKMRIREEVREMARMLSPLFEEEYKRGREEGFREGVQQGIQQGVQQGIQQGIQQGMQEGLKEGKREKLIALIELKYGEKGIELIPLVSKLDDIGVIDALSELVKLVDDYERFKKKFMEFLERES